MDTPTFIRYLAAKRSVDDRSLNSRVWDAMIQAFDGARGPGMSGPRVLELGAGIGTMVTRVAEDGRLRPSSWTLLDGDPLLVEEARNRLQGSGAGMVPPFPVEAIAGSLDAFLRDPGGRYDLVVANAFLDLVDAPAMLPRIAELGAPGARFLFSITFDGLTIFEPEIDRDLDERIMALYHGTMDERVVDGARSGDSRCGRHLLGLLPRSGCRIEMAGSSDWIVYPRDGTYPGDEGFFLSCLLDFVQESLSGRPELDRRDLRMWIDTRRAQLASAELIYIAHQLDVLASGPP